MKGILFKPEVWKAKQPALDEYGEAQTRRLDGLKEINQEPDSWECIGDIHSYNSGEARRIGFKHKRLYLRGITPRYQVGETVYIKEAWWQDQSGGCWGYKADGIEWPPLNCGGKAISPLFMPEWAARHFITITGVRAERLQEITEEDAWREGFPLYLAGDKSIKVKVIEYSISCFIEYWNTTNPKYPWELNPFVWVYSFNRE